MERWNIWLEPNGRGGYTVKVLDFGLVKLGDRDEGRGFTPVNADLSEIGEESATLIKPIDSAQDESLTALGSVMGYSF